MKQPEDLYTLELPMPATVTAQSPVPPARPQLVLSLFPCIDMLGRGFEAEGFCVVRGPDPIFGGDIRDFHPAPGRFDGIIGGPPCQDFSRARRRPNPLPPRAANVLLPIAKPLLGNYLALSLQRRMPPLALQTLRDA